MSHNTEVLRSLAASALQQGRGIASKGHRKTPQEPLELYDMEGCPFCRLVREALTDLDLDVLIFPCPKGGERYRPLVERLGGRQQFPYLMDPNTGAALYESADIIDYLYREYGGRPAPRRWLVRSLRTAAAVSASLPRASRGLHARQVGTAAMRGEHKRTGAHAHLCSRAHGGSSHRCTFVFLLFDVSRDV